MSLDFLNVVEGEMVVIEPHIVAVYLLKMGLAQQGPMTDFTS